MKTPDDQGIHGIRRREGAEEIGAIGSGELRAGLVQISITRSMSRCTSGVGVFPLSFSLIFIGIADRSWVNPACISAEMLRARARAWTSAGQMAGWRSARYSAMAMDSPHLKSVVVQAGHRAFPARGLEGGVVVAAGHGNRAFFRKPMPKCFISSHRRDSQARRSPNGCWNDHRHFGRRCQRDRLKPEHTEEYDIQMPVMLSIRRTGAEEAQFVGIPPTAEILESAPKALVLPRLKIPFGGKLIQDWCSAR